MKFKREIMAIILVICLLFTISAISAADSDIETVSATNESVEAVANDYSLESENDVEILSDVETDDGSFAALDAKISGAAAGSTIYLNNDYEYKSTDTSRAMGIYILHSLTIDGQGHKIDAKGNSRIFYVYNGSSSIDVTLKNITFVNGKYGWGGAVYWRCEAGGDGNIINCNFIDNVATDGDDNGAAIYDSSGPLNIRGSTFINNHATSTIVAHDDVEISNSIFLNNDDVILEGDTITANNNWYGNTVDNIDDQPKVIDAIVNNYYVLDMNIDRAGIATVSLNNLYKNGVLNPNDQNYALPSIKFDVSAVNITVGDSVTLGNSGTATITYTPVDGYSLTINYNGIEITKNIKPNSFSTLKDEIMSGGNEIKLDQDYVYDSAKDSTLENGIDFSKDVTIDGQGHVIDAQGLKNIFYFNDDTYSKSLTLKNIIFKNAVGEDGAVIYFKGKKIEIDNCIFIDNTATNSLIYIDSSDDSTVSNSIFIGNSATNNIVGSGNVIANGNWWGNTFENYDSDMAKCSGVTIENSLYLDIEVTTGITGTATISLNNAYDGSVASKYDNYALPTVMVNFGGSDVTIDMANIEIGQTGEATYQFGMDKKVATLTANYESITATKNIEHEINDDGSFRALNEIIYFSNEGDVIEFTHDYVYSSTDVITEGILIPKTLTINGNGYKIDAKGKSRIFDIIRGVTSVSLNNISFENGKFETGAAIYVEYYSDNCKIINCNFTNNVANKYAGAIYIVGDYCTIDKCNFENNGANYGGVIAHNHDNVAYIKNSKFANNYLINGNSGWMGGGVFYGFDGKLDVDKSVFINNNAKDFAGAVLYTSKPAFINNSIFLNNVGLEDFDIYGPSSISIENSWFGNTIENYNSLSSEVYSAITPNSWYYLDINTDVDNHAIVELKLYNRTTQTSSINKNYNNLPEITFKLTKQNINFDETEIKLNESGQYDVEYTFSSGTGSITAECESSKVTKDLVFGDFNKLQKLINDAKANDVIELTRNYTYTVGFDTGTAGITISKTLTINGNGNTIDAKDKSRIFNLAAYGLTIKNITFVNGKNSGNGGIINVGSSNVKFVDCTFINCSANNGGAIYNSASNLNITNCTFINTTATNNGGAINSNSGDNLYVLNCTFINCSATYDGGAIRANNGQYLKVLNSTFISNTANYGAVIYRYAANSLISNCTFIKNYGKGSNPVIVSYGENFKVDKSIFIENDAKSGYLIHISKNTGNVSNSIFLNNKGKSFNGPFFADYNWFGNTEDNPSTDFANGRATKWYVLDMAVDNVNNISTLSLNNLWDGSAYSPYDGYALRQIVFNLQPTNANIDKNNWTADKNSEEVSFSLIDPSDSGTLTVSYDGFEFSKNIGQISNEYSFTALKEIINAAEPNSVIKLEHSYRYIAGYDDAITAAGISIDKKNLTIDGNGFTLDAKEKSGIFTVESRTTDVTVKNINFINAAGNGALRWYLYASNGKVINCTFENCKSGSGAAIYFSSQNGNIINSTFIKNVAETNGAAICINYPANVLNCTFIDNKARNGGAVYVSSENVNIDKSIFIGNTATTQNGDGGAIYWQSGTDGNVSNSIFLNNKATTSANNIFYNSGSLVANNNWFGNTKDDFSTAPTGITASDSLTLNNWLYLNATHDDVMVIGQDNPVKFIFELYENGEVSDYDASKVHEYNLTLSSTKGDLDKTNVLVGNEFNYNPTELGTGTITAKYADKQFTINLENKYPSEIICDDESIDFESDEKQLDVTFDPTDLDTSLLEVSSSYESIVTARIDNGNIYIAPGNAGTAQLTIKFKGNDEYVPSEKTITVTVNKIDSSVTFNDIVMDYQGSNTTTLTLEGCSVDVTNITVVDHTEAVSDYNTETKVITVSGLESGTYTLKVTTTPDSNHNSVTETSTITVNKIVPTITIEDVESVDVGNSLDIVASVTGGGTLTYVSNDTAVATVDSNTGRVTGVKGGKANITVKSAESKNYLAGEKNITLTVNRIVAKINATAVEVIVKDNAELDVKKPSDYDGTITFESLNTEVASVSDKTVTGVAAGSTTIKISWTQTDKYLSGSYDVAISVVRISPNLQADEIEVKYNQTGSFTIIQDGDGALSFVSADENIATVSSTGEVKGTGIGETKITITVAETDRYIEQSIQVNVKVVQASPNLETETLKINVGNTEQLEITHLGDGALTYESLNTDIVTVDSAGKVTAIEEGETKIRVTIAETQNYTAQTIEVPVISTNKIIGQIVIPEDQVKSVDVDDTITIGATTNSDADLKYTVNDTSVATVDENTGKVTGIKGGKAKVTITLPETHDYLGTTKDLEITVNKLTPTITIKNGESASIDAERNVTIDATVNSSGELTYKSNDSSIATVDADGLVIGLKGGKVNITVYAAATDKYLAGSKNITVTVNPIVAKINASDIAVNVNADGQIDVKKPSDYDDEITFVSQKEANVTVDAGGKVTAIKGGDVVVTINWVATDKYVAGSYDVTVTVNKIVADISAEPLTVKVNETKELKVIKPADFDGNIVYTSESVANATVDSNANVTGHKGGDVEIILTWAESDKYLAGSATVTVTVEKLEQTITVNDTGSVDAEKTLDVNASTSGNGVLTYESNDTAVASVDSNGVVTGIKSGKVKITVKALETDEYLSNSKDIIVTVNKIDAGINASDISVDVFDDGQIDVKKPSDYDGEITFVSQKEANVTVDAGGKVTAIKGGDVVVTINWAATDKYVAGSYDVTVTVNKIDNEITVENEDSISVNVKDTITISATANGATLNFTSNDTSIATVGLTDGVVTGIKGGKVKITIKSSETDQYINSSKDIVVTVDKISPNLKADTLEIEYNHTGLLVPTYDGDGTLTYENVSTNIATVDSDGKVTAVNVGETTIKVTVGETDEYSEQTIEVTVNVIRTSPNLQAEDLNIKIGNLESINTTYLGDGSLSYVIDDETIAFVNNDKITGRSEGTTTLHITIAESENYTEQTIDVQVSVTKKEQGNITISDSQVYSVDADDSILINASANYDDAILKYEIINTTGAASLKDNNLTGLKGGEVVVKVTLDETHDYLGDIKSFIVTVNKLTPTIKIDGKSDVNVDNNITISANTTSGSQITFESNDTSVATVDSNGVVTGITGGIVNITVTSPENDKYLEGSQNILIKVNKLPPTITINDGELVSIDVGQTVNINATTDSNGTLTFESNNTSIATIDDGGNITGVTGDDVNITVSVAETPRYLPKTQTVPVKVNKLKSKIEVENDKLVVDVDGNVLINASSNNHDVVLEYSSTNDKIAIVDSNGRVTGVIGGNVTVTITSPEDDKYLEQTKVVTVTVNKLPAIFTANDLVIDVDDTLELEVNCTSDATLELTSNNETIATVDSASHFVSALIGGKVNITVNSPETDKYLANSTNVLVTVNKLNNTIFVDSIDVDVNKTNGIIAEAEDNAELTYESCNTTIATVDGSGIVKGLIGGVVNITITSAETDKYLSAKANVTVTVNKLPTVIEVINPNFNVDAFKNITLIVNAGEYNGIFKYESNDTSVATVKDAVVVGVSGGDVLITITAPETDKFLSNSTTVKGTVNKVDSTTTVDAANITVGETSNAFITIPDVGIVNITLYKGSEAIYSENVTVDRVYRFENADLAVGSYRVSAKFYGSNKYLESENATEFIVKPIYKFEFDVKVDDTDLGETTNVTVTLPDDATGKIFINGQEYDIKGSQTTITLPAQSVSGKNNITVEYVADENSPYDSSKITAEYDVAKIEPEVNIEIPQDIKAGEDFTINVTSNGAQVEVYVDGEKQTVTDGKVTIPATAGKHTVIVSTVENENFTKVTQNATFTVDKLQSTVSVNASEAKVGEKSTIKVNVTDGATGIVVINVNGTEYSIDLAKTDSISVALENVGDYTISAKYLGDDKYDASESEPVSVKATQKEASNIVVEIPEDIKIGETVTINVTSDSDDVTVLINGEPQQVKDGKVEFTPTSAGAYSIVVKSGESENYQANETVASFKVDKNDASVEIIVPETIKVGEDVEITVSSTSDVDVSVYVDGEKQTVENGKVTFKATAGKHTIVASTPESDNYLASNANATFAVDKLESTIKVNATETKVGAKTQITVNVTDGATGVVIVNVNGSEYSINLEQTNTVSVVLDKLGKYEISAKYLGDDKYEASESEVISLETAQKESPEITMDVPSIKVGEDATVTVAIPNATGKVSVIIDGNESELDLDENGTAKLTVKDPAAGKHDVVVIYDGDENYASKHVVDSFDVAKQSSELIVSEIVPEIGKDTTIPISIYGATGNVTVIVDGKEQSVPLENGKANVTVPSLAVGDHSVVVIYSGDETHDSAYVAIPVESSYVASEFTNITVYGSGLIEGYLVDANGNPMHNAPITYKVNGVEHTAKADADGKVSIDVDSNAFVEISYGGDDRTLPANITLNLDSLAKTRVKTQILGDNYTQYAIEYYAGERGQNFTVQLKDINGKVLANKKVLIGYNGKTLERITDENGHARVQINLKDQNRLTFAVSFLGDEDYEATMSVYLITIVKKPVTITAPAKTFKKSTKTKTYTVTLKTITGASATGKTVFGAGKKVTLKVNGKTYNVKTNAKGQAVFKITNLNKKGKFSASIKYAGDTTYESVTKSVKITVK